MFNFFASRKSKTLAKFTVPQSVSRISKRKFSRVLYQGIAFLKGFAFGCISVLVLVLAFMSKSYAQSTNGQCGGTSQPRCEVNVPMDATTASAAAQATTDTANYNTWLKGTVNWVPNNGFTWSFIPNIPTSSCTNLQLQSPIGGPSVEMDICSPFNKFQVFMNGVLGFFCLLGCVRQVQSALES